MSDHASHINITTSHNHEIDHSNSNTSSVSTRAHTTTTMTTLTGGQVHTYRQDGGEQQQQQQTPQAVPEEEFTIRVLTLNCWGLWLGAKKRRQRMAGIVRYLRENNCDIVFLQEVWVTSDFEIIRNGTRDIYRFAHLFRSGSVLGSSGIVILCRWTPRVIHFEPYSLNGSPFYPWHGDWFAGKGIAYSRVDFDGLSLHLFSTHTHAYYKENEPVHDQYSVHRICQSYQLARFITFIRDTACNRRAHGKDLMIVAGDMNSTSSELPYKILTTMAGLTDCFKASRYNNPASNIIHRHKLMSHRKKTSSQDDVSTHSSTHSGVGFLQTKFADNSLLETIEGYKNRIAQVLFDSDTDDEDITYCHPRNSFTPSAFLRAKAYQFAKNAKSAISHQEQSTSSSSSSSSRATTSSNPKSGPDDRTSDDVKPDNCNTNGNNNNNNNNRSKRRAAAVTAAKSPMKRIDFILCSLLTHGHCVVDKIDSESKDPSLDCSLSDHEPVMVELKICDISHDLMEKNRIDSDSNEMNKRRESIERSRPLASVLASKEAVTNSNGGVNLRNNQPEETTNQWVSERAPVNLTSYQECNIQVMEETQDLLMQYYQYNRTSKTQLFYVVLFMFIITLPTTTYYALSNELIPLSTIVFMWFAFSFLFSIGLLIGFLSYRYEQGAIEAILNDIICKISVVRRHNEKNIKADRMFLRAPPIDYNENEHQL